MSKFNQGDLALIVGAFSMAQNIGKVVELVQFVTDGEFYVAPDGITYQHGGVACWVVVGDGVVCRSSNAIFNDFGLHVEQHLMPLRGGLAPTERKQQELTV